jgi:hypothetical protein
MIARLLAAAFCAVSFAAPAAAQPMANGESLAGYERDPYIVAARALYCKSTEEISSERSQYMRDWDVFSDIAALWSVLYGHSLRQQNVFEYSSGATSPWGADPARDRTIRAACHEDLRRLQALGGTLERTWDEGRRSGQQTEGMRTWIERPLATEPERAAREAGWCLEALGFVQRRLPASAASFGIRWSDEWAGWRNQRAAAIAPWQDWANRLTGTRAQRTIKIRPLDYDGFYQGFAAFVQGEQLATIRRHFVVLEANICAGQMSKALQGGAR